MPFLADALSPACRKPASSIVADSFIIPLCSNGYGIDLGVLTLKVNQPSLATITGEGMFLINGHSDLIVYQQLLLPDCENHLFIKIPLGFATVNVSNGKGTITEIIEWDSSSPNSPIITGFNLADLPLSLLYFNCSGNNTIIGCMAILPPSCTHFSLVGDCSLSYLAKNEDPVISDNLNYYRYSPSLATYFDTTEIDRFLIFLATLSWYGESRSLVLSGTCPFRSESSDNAVFTLTNYKNVAVQCNDLRQP